MPGENTNVLGTEVLDFTDDKVVVVNFAAPKKRVGVGMKTAQREPNLGTGEEVFLTATLTFVDGICFHALRAVA